MMSCTRGKTMTSSVPRMRRVRLARPNGSATRGAQRADLEAAAPIGGEAVRGARVLARFERGEQEPRRARRPRSKASETESVGMPPVGRRLHDDVDAAVDTDLQALLQLTARARWTGW